MSGGGGGGGGWWVVGGGWWRESRAHQVGSLLAGKAKNMSWPHQSARVVVRELTPPFVCSYYPCFFFFFGLLEFELSCF